MAHEMGGQDRGSSILASVVEGPDIPCRRIFKCSLESRRRKEPSHPGGGWLLGEKIKLAARLRNKQSNLQN
jgi:hypothetical protein